MEYEADYSIKTTYEAVKIHYNLSVEELELIPGCQWVSHHHPPRVLLGIIFDGEHHKLFAPMGGWITKRKSWGNNSHWEVATKHLTEQLEARADELAKQDQSTNNQQPEKEQ